MPKIVLTTFINAPAERCFDLARSIDLHMQTTGGTGEKAIAGRTNGLIEKGETVTWEAVHFGIKQKLTSRIADMRIPSFFSDEMTQGAFKSMYHEHSFESREGGTLMTDDFSYETPYGIAGKLFDLIVLKRYLSGFLIRRNAMIKQIAEGEEWKNILR